VAASGEIEEEATNKVCAVVKEKFPYFNMDAACRSAVRAMWDEAKATCPNARRLSLEFPGRAEIQTLVCQAATSESLEKEGTQAMCRFISREFPSLPEGTCVKIARDFWDQAKAMCPNQQNGSAPLPIPGLIKKVLCDVAASGEIEEEATNKVCAVVKEKFPYFNMDAACRSVVRAMWDEAKATCPSARRLSLEFPGRAEIQTLVCQAATSESVEKQDTQAMCRFISHAQPSLPEGTCVEIARDLWDQAKARCLHRSGPIHV